MRFRIAARPVATLLVSADVAKAMAGNGASKNVAPHRLRPNKPAVTAGPGGMMSGVFGHR